jgi:PIN domain
MDRAFPDALVTSDYQAIVGTLRLPDAKDRHVLAAAIASRCDVIVTFNLKDFPTEIVSGFGIDVQHPDEFLLHQFSLAPPEIVAAARAMRRRLHNPAATVAEFLEGLRRAGLPMVADALLEHAAYL